MKGDADMTEKNIAFGVPSWPGDIDIAAERVRSDMQVI